MTTAKALILTGVILAVAVFAVFGIREVKKNNKKSFGESTNIKEIEKNGSTSSPTERKFSFKDIVQDIKDSIKQ